MSGSTRGVKDEGCRQSDGDSLPLSEPFLADISDVHRTDKWIFGRSDDALSPYS